MHPHRRLANAVILCSPLLLAFNVGCPGDGGLLDLNEPFSLDAAMDSESFVGGNDERLVFISTDYEGLPTVTLWDLITGSFDISSLEDSIDVVPAIRVSAVDPNSLEATPLTGLGIDSEWGTLSDGRWLAWTRTIIEDDYDNTIHVFDLETGTQARYFEGYGSSLWMTALENGRLVLPFSTGPDTYVVVLDLGSGEASLLPTGITDYEQLAVHGDWLAMSYHPPLDSPPTSVGDLLAHSGPESANIDVINLSTGESRTIVGVDEYTSLRLTDTQVLWTHVEGQTATIRAQDLAGGQTQDLITFTQTDDDDETIYIQDAGTAGLILKRSVYPDDFNSHELYELHTPDGRTITILDYTYGDAWEGLNPIWPSPQFVGTAILYHDPDSKDWVLFDPATESRRTVRPFAQ